MKLVIDNYVNHLPPGNYKGYIVKETESEDSKYLWLNIELMNENTVLNISIPTKSFILQNFAKYFVVKDNEVDTSDFINTLVDFTVEDKKINDDVFSKFKRLIPIFDNEEETDND